MNHSIEDISNLVRLLNSESTENFQLAVQIAKGMDLPKAFYRGLTKTKYACWLCLNEDLLEPLKELEKLDFSFMGLRHLPEQLGELTQLKALELDYHRLETLPEYIGKLEQLEKLDLFYGKLKNLPNSLEQLLNLKHLDLRQNRFITLPAVLKRMPWLEMIEIAGNNLSDETIEELKGALPKTKIQL